MNLRLYRTRTRELTTDGVLMGENGIRICDTSEHSPTMLPPGDYVVELKKHPILGHRTMMLTKKSRRKLKSKSSTKGWIMSGNGAYSARCASNIIVGTHLVPGVVTQSRPCFQRLVKRIEKILRKHRKVMLIIR